MTDVRSIPTWVRSGLDASKGTPSYVGETYYATDTEILYIANGTSSSADWDVLIFPPTAKGDIIGATGADVWSRLAVGTDGYLLSANSGESTGLEWVAPSTATSKDRAQVSGFPDATLVAASTSAVIDWNTEDIDVGGMVDLGANNTRITIKTAGDYLCQTHIQIAMPASGSGTPIFQFRKNGTTFFGPAVSQYHGTGRNLSDLWFEISVIETFALNDYFELYCNNSAFGIIVSVSGLGQNDLNMMAMEL